ncbi:MAG: hypothetical protein U5L09_22930 [Bacteroidales bacterium]|nr:hypothetical protein [Bacteroidales bacterium]
MQWPTNSPFVQMKKGQKPHLLKLEDRQEKLVNLHEKISRRRKTPVNLQSVFQLLRKKNLQPLQALSLISISHLMTQRFHLKPDIGSGLSLGVSGGFAILFDQPEILLKTFEGWKVYRQFLNDPSLEKLAPNKITSWNGQWLSYAYSDVFRVTF